MFSGIFYNDTDPSDTRIIVLNPENPAIIFKRRSFHSKHDNSNESGADFIPSKFSTRLTFFANCDDDGRMQDLWDRISIFVESIFNEESRHHDVFDFSESESMEDENFGMFSSFKLLSLIEEEFGLDEENYKYRNQSFVIGVDGHFFTNAGRSNSSQFWSGACLIGSKMVLDINTMLNVFKVQDLRRRDSIDEEDRVLIMDDVKEYYQWVFWVLSSSFAFDEHDVHSFVVAEYNEPNLYFQGPTTISTIRMEGL